MEVSLTPNAVPNTTSMDPGNISLALETQTDLSRGDWNQYSSSVYSEGYLDKKGEALVVDGNCES
jgi:hypothetical protein